jgi:hypothetical protein
MGAEAHGGGASRLVPLPLQNDATGPTSAGQAVDIPPRKPPCHGGTTPLAPVRRRPGPFFVSISPNTANFGRVFGSFRFMRLRHKVGQQRLPTSIGSKTGVVALAPDVGIMTWGTGVSPGGAFVPYGRASTPTIHDARAAQGGVAAGAASTCGVSRRHKSES